MVIKKANTHHTVGRILRAAVIFLFVLYFLNSSTQSQTRGFILSGTVTDIENGSPIENVNIRLRNSKTGATTDILGRFMMNINTLPQYIEFSHIGYETTVLRLEHEPLQAIQVNLSPRSETLSEVVITSQRIDTLFADRLYSILDYALSDKGMLLLIYKANLSRSELLLKDYSGNKLMEMKVLPMKPLALFKDCLNELHILSKNRSYQILFQDKQLSLYPPYDLDHFTKVMASCKFQIRNKVYFEEYLSNELIKRIHYVDTTDNSSHILVIISDKEKLGFLQQNPENYALGRNQNELSLLNSMRGLQSDSVALSQLRNMDVDLRFNKMAYLSKIIAPVFALRDTVIIFNHPSNAIEFYNSEDSLLGTTPISYHLPAGKDSLSDNSFSPLRSSKWLKEIYVDAIRNRAYTSFKNINGTRDLKEIDLGTGKTKYILTIPFPYVQKLQIREGYVYFIYKGFGETKKKKLFRQKIN